MQKESLKIIKQKNKYTNMKTPLSNVVSDMLEGISSTLH
jgi:hypothetical protein